MDGTALPPLTVGRFVGTWHLDGWVTAAVVLLAVGYALGVRAARRRGVVWPLWRTFGFSLAGLGLLVVSTMSSLAVYSHVLLWPAAVQVTLLLTVVPVGLGLGEPLGLVTAALPPHAARRWQGWLHSGPVRVLTFPAVGPLLAVVTQFVLFFTGYLGAAERSTTVMHLLQLQLVVTGCLFALPLLGFEVLPAWCTQPVRMVIAGIDGLLDAVPGIAVTTSSSLIAGGWYSGVSRTWGPSHAQDQLIAGGLMITVAETVAVPFLAVVFRAWIHEDAAHARDVDDALDAAEVRLVMAATDEEGPVTDRPWWETDQGPVGERVARFRGPTR